MQAFTIVVKMTGLLLVTPHSATNGPTQVLLPLVPENVEQHVAQIGYFKATNEGCDWYDRGICYLDLDGRTVEIGPGANSTRKELSHHAGNLKGRMRGRLPNDHAGTNPSGVRSRVTLAGGSALPGCSEAEWDYIQSVDNPSASDRLELINVLEWRIPEAGRDRFRLVRKMKGNPNDSSVTVVLPTNPTANPVVELFIRHVPRHEAEESWVRAAIQLRKDVPSGSQPAPTHHDEPRCPGGQATHFLAYYELLQVDSAHRGHLPVCVKKRPKCIWREGRDNEGRMTVWRNAGSLNCMITSADPQ